MVSIFSSFAIHVRDLHRISQSGHHHVITLDILTTFQTFQTIQERLQNVDGMR